MNITAIIRQLRTKKKYPARTVGAGTFCVRNEIYCFSGTILYKLLVANTSDELVPMRLQNTKSPTLYLTSNHLKERQLEDIIKKLKQYAI